MQAYKQSTLLKLVGCSRPTLTTYLSRIEFSHIKSIYVGHIIAYRYVRDEDISRLKQLINRRRKKKNPSASLNLINKET